MEVLLGILAVFLILVIASITTVLLVARAIYRRVRRSRAVADTALRARAGFSHGPRRRVLALRVRLAETLESGRAAIELAAERDGAAPSELPRLFRRVQEEAAALDLQLRLLESETDQAVLAVELPAAAGRVEQVAGLVRRLRSAVASALAGSTDETLTDLQSELEREVAALAAGVEELRRLNRRDQPGRPPAHPPTRPPGATATTAHRPRRSFELKESRP